MRRRTISTLAFASLIASVVFADPSFENDIGITVEVLPEGSVSEQDGLLAFDRIFEVASHPRCANCHVDDSNLPMWSGNSYGKTRRHGMNVDAGTSRIGVDTLPCWTCHRTDGNLDSEAHAPPHFGIGWQLAPVSFVWFGQTPRFICEQMKDPQRNGNRDGLGLVRHLVDDANHRGPVLWGWNPGGEREPAPYSLQEHVNDVLVWVAAGQPCPEGSIEQVDYLADLLEDE